MSDEFQTAVKKNIDRTRRTDAINQLQAYDERTNLALLVRTGGLAGEFRRQALEALIESGATAHLESISEDRSVPPSLRRRAEEAV